MTNSEYISARLAHGSLCSLCPLQGQRMVGKDGNVNAGVYGIGEAPGEDEERWGLRRGQGYGTPFVGKSGYRMRIENLVPASLATLEKREGSYPRITLSGDVLLINVLLCRPPGNDIDTPIGRKAVRCCANSLRWFLRTRLEENPNRTVVPIGGTSLSTVRRRKSKIDAHRGRVTHAPDVVGWALRTLEPEPEADILRDVLKGQKPKEEWWPAIEWFLKGACTASRASLRKVARQNALDSLPSPIVSWSKEWKKQKTALKKKASSTAIATD